MRLWGTASWQITIDRWNQQYDCALWIRAAERIEVPADALVPGPLDIPAPPPGKAEVSGLGTGDALLGEAWLVAWRELAGLPGWHPETSPAPPPRSAFAAPDFPGLAAWPTLRELLLRRWPEAHEWHDTRKLTELREHIPPARQDGEVVREVERSLHRPVRPFEVEFVLLPVRDDAIRQVHAGRYLVPERVYDGPQWTSWLRELVRRIG